MSSIKLPQPRDRSNTSIEQALAARRSVRRYTDLALTLADVSQLLWSAQGMTDPMGLRTAPSAGALFPLELYSVVGDLEGLSVGIYKYKPREHELERIADGDKRRELSRAALGQSSVRNAPLVIGFCAVYARVTGHYGERGIQYVHMEVGHAAQNIHLQVLPLNLGTVVIGAFHDQEVKRVLHLPPGEQPLYLMPVGRL